MSPTRTFLVGAAVILGALALLLATPKDLSFGEHENGYPRWNYLFEDVYDRGAYQQRGRWLPAGLEPYTEEFSEYPQISTWLMAVPYLFVEHDVERGLTKRADPERYNAEIQRNYDAYGDAHHLLMAGWFVVLLALVIANLRALGERPEWALLLLLPGPLYFGFNRFDLVIASMVAGAILLQLRGHPRAAALALGVAFMTKWYPLVLVPFFLSRNVALERGRGAPLGRALVRGAAVPGALIAAVVAAVLGVTWVFQGGQDAVLSVFRWHASVREPNHASLVGFLTSDRAWGLLDPSDRPWLERLLLALMLLPPWLLALRPVRSREALLLGCLWATTGMLLFSKFFSPQWVLWVVAIGALLAPRSRAIAALVAAIGLAIYLQLPITWYYGRPMGAPTDPPLAFWYASNLRFALLAAIFAVGLAAFLRSGARRD